VHPIVAEGLNEDVDMNEPQQDPIEPARPAASLFDNARDNALLQEAGREMAMYVAIVGKLPAIDPAVTTTMDEIEEGPKRRDRPWSPFVLSLHLRDIARQGAMKLHRPEISAWIRKQSEIAMRRLHESHTRMLAAKNDRAA
jgi:hypothetical protein